MAKKERGVSLAFAKKFAKKTLIKNAVATNDKTINENIRAARKQVAAAEAKAKTKAKKK